MNESIKNIVTEYWGNEISKETLLFKFDKILIDQKINCQLFYELIIINKDVDILEYVMTIGYELRDENKFIDFIHKVILEPWHNSYEEMAHFLQRKKKPASVEPLKNAIQKKYEYLESYGTGTRQFINQCGHALWSIGTEEAILVIKELATSTDPIIKDEMLYRMCRIEKRNDYERNYDL